jgi:hypothetical protein
MVVDVDDDDDDDDDDDLTSDDDDDDDDDLLLALEQELQWETLGLRTPPRLREPSICSRLVRDNLILQMRNAEQRQEIAVP